jgi:hypothetical protein
LKKKKKKKGTWGGARKGAGRPPKFPRTVAHRKRPPHDARKAVTVTLRVRDGIASLRTPAVLALIHDALEESSPKPRTFRITRSSILEDRLELVVRARDRIALSRGVQSIGVRLARRLNTHLGLRGKLWRERFDLHAR